MTQPISFLKVLDHEKLTQRLNALRAVVAVARMDAPDGLASSTLSGSAAHLLRDLYSLVSREPGARALPRLRRHHPPGLRALSTMLRDAQMALDAFAYAHRNHDDGYGDEWLTLEGIEMFRESPGNLSPPLPRAS